MSQMEVEMENMEVVRLLIASSKEDALEDGLPPNKPLTRPKLTGPNEDQKSEDKEACWAWEGRQNLKPVGRVSFILVVQETGYTGFSAGLITVCDTLLDLDNLN
ncbi:Hypothetical predicted protein [Mytilus galloprovincialis]|uniref:Uncharacterized protein n=1 Tax=Mytilus galloprovincialis TaxID=29158 RepID=A0A8B6FY07_MYTGA|nr:Hypothetical predicted protein [Mytilus galloprovincialis]